MGPNLKAWKMGLFYNSTDRQGTEPEITPTLQTWPQRAEHSAPEPL